MDIGRPNTRTEAQTITGMVQYYKEIQTRWSYLLGPITEAASGPNIREILWNDKQGVAFCDIKRMVSAETLLNYIDQTIPLTVHTYTSNKQLGDVITQKDKPITLFSKKSINTQSH